MKVLFVNQSFLPDVTATAQYLGDLTEDLTRHGFEIEVLASRRNYLAHRTLHAKSEMIGQVRITRVWTPYFFNGTRLFRCLNAIGVSVAFAWHVLCAKGVDVIVLMTTPPLIEILAIFVRKRAALVQWAMDINPDQAARTGWISATSLFGRILFRLHAASLHRISKVIVLDRHMQALLLSKGVRRSDVEIIPLWADCDRIGAVAPHENRFRQKHAPNGEFLVMYSGNHSICHPLDTLLGAALLLRDRQDIRFLFIGSGARFSEVRGFCDRHGLRNVSMLPYQDRKDLSQSLSAADLHVVSMGDEYVGVVHPSKPYHIMAVGRPILYLGPKESSVGELLAAGEFGFQVEHGDTERAAQVIVELCDGDARRLQELSARSSALAWVHHRENATGRFAEVLRDVRER